MRSLWLLPDTEQSGVIQALEGADIGPVHERIDLNLLPPCFVLGIPESVLRENPSDKFAYAQYARLADGMSVFACSMRSGRDRGGRTVMLTNLQYLDGSENAIFPPELNCNAGAEIFGYMSNFESMDDGSKRNIELMLKAVRLGARASTFSSEKLLKAVNKPDWMPLGKKSQASSWQ
ncbi:hypothetical protein [Ectopseudomonas composti]|uniref:hypothetical protein n=1 Tax=Ectopseudomonas composti TaxID=658457 RepID=UPI0011138EAB|nr:hypothetical protein [Pseudomonas composti]